MKRKTAREILTESFRELALSMPIDKITVRDIVNNCGYSQATFYRQFKDKYDLIAWSYTEDLEAVLKELNGDAYSWRKALENAAHYFQEHRQYLANLLTHTSGYDAFIFHMTDIHARGLERVVERLKGSLPEDSPIRYYVQIYCYGSVLFSCDWILGKYDMNEKELADIFEKALPAALLPYLT
ncbi:MAG: TetR/AcrR family transcriptional regulator C-terminal domain-containing protein [Clostridia bacterium]|nr:TetR/AcrR family transcriptional regulator C-terminal domain-containing protein [Clostridia bacterium]